MDELANALSKILADIATQISKQALGADPGLASRLLALDGRRVEIQCTQPLVTWQLLVTGSTLSVVSGAAESPHAIVRGSAIDLAAWLLPGKGSAQVQISGDDALLLQLAEILGDFSPDLAEPISAFLGAQTAATLLGTAELGLKSFAALIESASRSVQGQAAEKFVRHDHLDTLLGGIDELRLRVDRLAAKVDRHERARPNTEPT